MIQTEYNSRIHELQKGILLALPIYKDYLYPEAKEWEKNFQPHITIAADLNIKQYEQALKDLKEDYPCTGVIKDVALIIVDKMIPVEADKPENQTLYYL